MRDLAGRDEQVAPAFHAFDRGVQNAELRRIDEIVRGVDRQQRRGDPFELRRRVVVAR